MNPLSPSVTKNGALLLHVPVSAACSSRGDKFAPGIWGTFVTRDEAAWGGDYHLNYNYQAPYWAAFSSNHIDLTKNFDQPLLDYMDMGRQHARELLNCKGIYYPVGIGPKGLCTSMWPSYSGTKMCKNMLPAKTRLTTGISSWDKK